jgi:EmrB/QacA subfamily drug resistance transporter
VTEQPPTSTGAGSSLFRLVVPPIILPVFLAAADGTIVATALPAIAAATGEVERLSWVVIVNLIASTIAAPAAGRLADLWGRRRLMIGALVFYALASVLAAVAPSFEALLLARALQGIGGGGLMTLAQALIGEYVPARERGVYQGYLSTNIVTGSTLGPILGGLMTEDWGWRAPFALYVPLCLIAILLVTRLPRDRAPAGRVQIDLAGMALLTLFVTPLLIAVSRLHYLDPAALPGIGLLLAIATAAFAALIAQQLRAPAPLLALSLFRNPSFWRADVMAFCSGASLVGLVTFLPIYLQVVTGASTAGTGLLMIPLTAAVASGSVVTGWLITRTGRTAIFPAIGLVITAVSLVALAIWAPVLSHAQLSVILAVGGLCQGSAMLTAQVTVQSVAGMRHLGAAAASAQLARSLGSAFGAAATGTVLFGTLTFSDPAIAALFLDMLRQGPEALANLPEDQRALARGELAQAFRGVFLTVAVFSVTIVAAAATLPIRRL